MTSQSYWGIGAGPIDPKSTERKFFTEHEWATILAAVNRIIPADELTPSAGDAGVVVYIDRYLSPGLDYIYAAADGSGFLKIEGRWKDAWKERIEALQKVYRDGVKELDKIAQERCGGQFKTLKAEQQDYVLELISHAPKPKPFVLGESVAVGSFLQAFNDDGLAFFDALVLHTRQGYYGDPVYGGNRDQVGWKSIGFPGPNSLKDTMTGAYSIRQHYHDEWKWEELISYLREKA